ncbi:MAG: hypothetical protein WCK15_15235 [Pirellula sp.]
MPKVIRNLFLVVGLCIYAGCSPKSHFNESMFSNLTEEQKLAIQKENADACNCSCGAPSDL